MDAKIAEECLVIVRSVAPIKTGNLRHNAIQLRSYGDNEFRIIVDGDGESGIAPYMPFTTEPWTSARWNRSKNPNEGWWDNAAELVAMHIAQAYGGEARKVNDND